MARAGSLQAGRETIQLSLKRQRVCINGGAHLLDQIACSPECLLQDVVYAPATSGSSESLKGIPANFASDASCQLPARAFGGGGGSVGLPLGLAEQSYTVVCHLRAAEQSSWRRDDTRGKYAQTSG